MHRERRAWAAAAAILLCAASASAATVVLPDGSTSKLDAAQEVTGPATVYAEDGKGRIRLHEGAVLRYLGASTDEKGGTAENFFLRSGACDADLGYYSRLSTPAFWVFPSKPDARISLRAETIDRTTGHARAGAESGLVRLITASEPHGVTEAQLLAGQGVALRREASGGIRFRTDFDNEWRAGGARILVPRPEGTFVDLYVPKATAGAVLPGAEGRVLVANGISSWRGGSIRCLAMEGEKTLSLGVFGPGTAASLDPKTGAATGPTEAEVASAAPLRLLPSAGADAGEALPIEPPSKFLVKKLHPRLEPERGRVFAHLWIENQGAERGPLSLEVVFAYAAPEDSSAPFVPAFGPVEAPALPAGGTWIAEVESPGRRESEPKFVRLLASSGSELPAATGTEASEEGLRGGTSLLGGGVEIVKMRADLFGAKPSLEFTLKNVAPPGEPPLPDEKDPFDPVGDLRYRVRFYRDGMPLDLGAEFDDPRPVGAPLGKRGETVTFQVSGLESARGLAGAWPVLTLMR